MFEVVLSLFRSSFGEMASGINSAATRLESPWNYVASQLMQPCYAHDESRVVRILVVSRANRKEPRLCASERVRCRSPVRLAYWKLYDPEKSRSCARSSIGAAKMHSSRKIARECPHERRRPRLRAPRRNVTKW